jgi:acyl-CoA reductase-like NAD-dependent aldehyde dehydrogenase
MDAVLSRKMLSYLFSMVVRKAGAALAAGCTMVIKPSPETPVSVFTLMQLCSEAGFANGVLNVLTTNLANTPAVSETLCRHPFVRKVTFTGSVSFPKAYRSRREP